MKEHLRGNMEKVVGLSPTPPTLILSPTFGAYKQCHPIRMAGKPERNSWKRILRCEPFPWLHCQSSTEARKGERNIIVGSIDLRVNGCGQPHYARPPSNLPFRSENLNSIFLFYGNLKNVFDKPKKASKVSEVWDAGFLTSLSYRLAVITWKGRWTKVHTGACPASSFPHIAQHTN